MITLKIIKRKGFIFTIVTDFNKQEQYLKIARLKK
jgi:hypothetical protein